PSAVYTCAPPASMVAVAGLRTMEASMPTTVTVGSDPLSTKSFPVPLKSFDCFALVCHVYTPVAAGAVAVSTTLTDCPGARELVVEGPGFRSWMIPETSAAVHTFPGGGVTVPTVTELNPAGTATLAEPRLCVLVGLLVL